MSGPDLPVRSDEHLVAAIRAGDAGAFSTMYRAYVGLIQRIARNHTSDPEEVADVVQETFTRALQRLESLRDPNALRAWLATIARHAAIDLGRRSAHVDRLDEGAFEAMPSGELGPEDSTELAELARLVGNGISTLSARDATAVSMVAHLGFSVAEVAGALGVSHGAAKVALHRARRRLRDAVSMEVLLRSRWSSCEEFDGLVTGGDTVAAARHAGSCPQCFEMAHAEVEGFGSIPAPGG